MAGFKASFFKNLGYSSEQIAALRRQYQINEAAQIATTAPVIRNLAADVQRRLIQQLMSSMKLLQKSNQRAISKLIDNLIISIATEQYITLNRKAARDVKKLVNAAFLYNKQPIDMLITETERVMEKSIFLLLQNAPIMRDLQKIRYANLRIAQDLAPLLPEIIKTQMAKAFISSWSGLSDDQFPRAYRYLILWVILNKLKIKVPVSSITNWIWTIQIDFNELFGDYQDLRKGYHYGAILESDDGESDIVQTSTIPYKEAKLKNPVNVRYMYWAALWKGQRFYSSFGARSRPYHKKKMREAKIQGEERIVKYNKYVWDKMKETSKKNSKGQYVFSSSEKFEEHTKRVEKLKRMRQNVKNLERSLDLPPLEIPAMLKEETIMARVDYWFGRKIAPVWLLLQYGQVRYPPVIPPKGVYQKFQMLVSTVLTEEITRRYNTEFAKLAYTSSGKVIIPDDRPETLPLPLGVTRSAKYFPLPGNKLYIMPARQAIERAAKNVEKMPAHVYYYYPTGAAAAAAAEIRSHIRTIPPQAQIKVGEVFENASERFPERYPRGFHSGLGSGIIGSSAYMRQLRTTGVEYFERAAPEPTYRSKWENMTPDMIQTVLEEYRSSLSRRQGARIKLRNTLRRKKELGFYRDEQGRMRYGQGPLKSELFGG